MAKQDATTQAIVVRSSSEIAALDEFDAILMGQAEAPEIVDDPEEISRQIMAQLLAAESDEELQNFNTAIGWANLFGVPIRLQGFRWRPSDYSEGAPVFVVVNGFRTDTGEAVVLTTGAHNVLAQLSNMARRGTLVGSVWSLEESDKETKSNFRPMYLKKAIQQES